MAAVATGATGDMGEMGEMGDMGDMGVTVGAEIVIGPWTWSGDSVVVVSSVLLVLMVETDNELVGEELFVQSPFIHTSLIMDILIDTRAFFLNVIRTSAPDDKDF